MDAGLVVFLPSGYAGGGWRRVLPSTMLDRFDINFDINILDSIFQLARMFQKLYGYFIPQQTDCIMGHSKLKVAINAVPHAPGGGMVGLIGYMTAWQELGAELNVTVYASRRFVIDAFKQACPDVDVVPFAFEQPPWKHFLLQQTKLGPAVMRRNADVLMTTQNCVRNCPVPQLVRHQNLFRFFHPTVWSRVRRRTLFDLREAVADLSTRRALRNSAVNVFISDHMRLAAEALVPESAPRNHVIHNALVHKVIEASRMSTTWWDGQPNLIAVQDTWPHKDNPTLIRTLERLVQLRPAVPWMLHVAGSGDWTKIKALARRLGVLDRITFHGYVDHDRLDELFRQSLCLVFTSVVEGFGNPPLESMARRCPAIACDCTAIPEVVGEAGILVPPGDSNAFAEAVVELYEDRAKRQAFVEKGLDRITMFDWRKSATAMLRLFREILSSSQANS